MDIGEINIPEKVVSTSRGDIVVRYPVISFHLINPDQEDKDVGELLILNNCHVACSNSTAKVSSELLDALTPEDCCAIAQALLDFMQGDFSKEIDPIAQIGAAAKSKIEADATYRHYKEANERNATSPTLLKPDFPIFRDIGSERHKEAKEQMAELINQSLETNEAAQRSSQQQHRFQRFNVLIGIGMLALAAWQTYLSYENSNEIRDLEKRISTIEDKVKTIESDHAGIAKLGYSKTASLPPAVAK